MTDGVEQVRLAEAGGSVDEQRVVRTGRCFSDAQRRRQGELVGRALDEGVEGVPGIETGGGRRAPQLRAGWRAGGIWAGVLADDVQVRSQVVVGVEEAVVGEVGAAFGLHDQCDDRIGDAELGEGGLQQGEVGTLDPISHRRAGYAEREVAVVQADGPHVLECREPDRFGNLGLQKLRRRRPQVFGLVHLQFRLLFEGGVHNGIHKLWTSDRPNGLDAPHGPL